MLTFRPPTSAVTAEVFVRQGNDFNPDIHIVATPGDTVAAEWTQRIINKYADMVRVYEIGSMFGTNTFVIELQFAATPEGRAVAQECLREYRRGFGKGGYVPLKKKALNARAKGEKKNRLLKNRMYRLPDGQFYWYFGLWDGHGNLVGKVAAADPPSADGILLENKIIHRSQLEEAVLIPKGEEPWGL